MFKKLFAFVLFGIFATLAQADLQTVASVDINRYLGDWEEIARFDNKHQQGCDNSKAKYTQKKGYVEIKNSCTLADGKNKEITGRAKIDDNTTNAKLKVNFTPFFIRMFNAGWGNYWIIELGNEYDYAVVSEPTMQYLWILSRQRPMSKALYDDIIMRLKAKGFDTEKLIVGKNAVAL